MRPAAAIVALLALAGGCAPAPTQFADAVAAKRAGKSLLVGELDPGSQVRRIDVYQAGRHVARLQPDQSSPHRGRRFLAAVPPGPVLLKAYIGTFELTEAEGKRRVLPVEGAFQASLDVPPDSVTYVGRLYDVFARQAALVQPGPAAPRAYRVWLQARDDWANAGGAEAYLRQYHPDCLGLFAVIRTAVQQVWEPH